MALRGDLLIIKVQQHSSGSVNEIIAESTDVNLDLSAEFLETTSQTSALNQTGIAGKVTGTASGSYLLASSGEQFTNLFAHMNAGVVLEIEIHRNGTKFIDCDGVISSLGLSGGLSDSLVTGAYSLQLSGDPS
jgi:hypothetical protein